MGQERNVARAAAQRRQLDVDHVDAIVQILAEAAFGNRLRQLFVRRQDHADIDLERLGAADLLELQLLQHAEQLHLHRRAGGADFVEEDRAAVGLQELAHLVAGRAGEGAGDVAEQFAFQQRFGKGTAGHFDERSFRPAAAAMDRAGDHRLARAALAGHQHRGPGVGHAADHLEDLQHARIAADDVVHADAAIELGLEILVFVDDVALRDGPLDRHQQLVVDQRLGEVVERPGANRFDRAVGRAVAGHQDDLRRPASCGGIARADRSRRHREADVGSTRSYDFAAELIERIGIASGRVELVALRAEPIAHRFEDVSIVVNQ